MKKVLLSILFVGVATLANAQKSELAEAKRLWGIFQFSMMVDPNAPKGPGLPKKKVSTGPASTGGFGADGKGSVRKGDLSKDYDGDRASDMPAAKVPDAGKTKKDAPTGSFIDRQIASLKDAMVHADNAIANEKTKGLVEPYMYKALFTSTIALVDTVNMDNSLQNQKDALAAITKAESLGPKGDEIENIKTARVNIRNAINGRAVRAYNKQDYKSALAGFNELVVINPLDTPMYINLGVTNKLLGQYAEAVKNFRKVIDFNLPETKSFYQETIAIVLNNLKDTTTTLDLLKQASVKYPDDPYFIGIETDIYITRGDVAKSQELLGKLIAKDPSKAVYHYLYGDTYYKQAFALQAVRDKIDAKKVKEYDAVGAKMLALIDQAIPYYKKAIEVDPKFVAALDTMSRIYAFKGDTKAYEEYKKKLEAAQASQ
jgi:tetratricopeptide (TPR) repeat protein